MALSIIKTDSRGAYRMVAEHDLYLDGSMAKIIVVKEGEEVPAEAAFVLAGKGGTVPVRYAEMLKALDAPVEVKGEVGEVKVEPEAKPTAPALDVKAAAKPAPAKAKSPEEKLAQ